MRKQYDPMVRKIVARQVHLKRVLGVAALFSAGYGNVGSSIYYALGIVALVAFPPVELESQPVVPAVVLLAL